MRTMRWLVLLLALLAVACKGKPKDADLEQSVKTKLASDPAALSMVTVQVKDRVVTLQGAVPNEGAKHAAHGLARDVDGVKDVVNQLAVSPESAANPQPTAAPVE